MDSSHGDLVGEVLKQPPRGSSKEEVGEGKGMKNLQKYTISFLLRFVGIGSESTKQFNEHPVVVGRSPNRRLNRAIRLVMSNIVKGALDSAKNVGRDIAEIVISKPVKGTKEPSGDGRSVPA